MNLLGAKLYDPAGAVSKATSSLLAMTALDTTNLRLTVTVPSHGFLFVKMRCAIEGATTFPQVLLGVLDGATVRGRVQPQGALGGTALATTRDVLAAEFTIPGLTPGSMTLDAAYGVEIVVAATNIKYGGPNNTTTDDAWGGFLFEIWDPQPQTTTGQLSVDANGRVDVIKVAGTTQTARDLGASVLLSSGTGAGQLDFTSGVVKANLAQILGTALTETAGQIAAAFKQFFNIASPTSTMNIITAVTTTTNLTTNNDKTGYGLSSAGIQAIWDALTSALTTASSIGKLLVDNINATISSRASQASLDTLDDYVDTEVAAIKAKTDNLPSDPADASDIAASFTTVNTKLDTIDDFLDTEVAAIKAKTDNLPSDPADQSILEGLIAAVQADTDNIQTRLPAALSGDGFIKADLLSIGDELVSGNNATLNLKKLNIVNNSGDALVASSTGGNGSGANFLSNGLGNAVNMQATGSASGLQVIGLEYGMLIQSQDPLEQLPGLYIEGQGDGLQSYGIAGHGINIITETGKSINAPNDIAVSDGDLTLAAIANAVWINATRTLTSFGTLIADIWTAVVDSPGVTTLLSRLTSGRAANLDNLDAAISSRLASVSYIAPDNAGITAIKAKTDNLPSDPADESLLEAAIATRSAPGDAMTLTSGEEDTIVNKVWDEAMADHLNAGSTGEKLNNSGAAGSDPWSTLLPGSYGAGTAGSILGNNLDAPVSNIPDNPLLDNDPRLNNLDAPVSAVPTAIDNADALLKRDWNAVTGEAARSVLNALRKLRNRVYKDGSNLKTTKENDTAVAYTQAIVTDSAQQPFKEIG